MSFTTYSKAATLGKLDRNRFALELLLLGITCEYPACIDPAVSVAESGVAMYMCLGHTEAWGSSSRLRRVIEMARLAQLNEEIMRTVAAAFEDPGEQIHWDGTTPLADQVFKGAEQVIASYQKREALPTAAPSSPAPSIISPKANGTLSTLTSTNEYELLQPFFV